MTLPQISSRNNLQKTNKRVIPYTNDVIQSTTWYTCPTGKITIIKGLCTCVDTGAGSVGDLVIAGISVAEWQGSGGLSDINLPQNLVENCLYPFTANLSAGDTIVTEQDAGTNAQFKLQMEIEEFII